MTTALTEGKWILEYKDRSSRQLYHQQCTELDIPINESIYHSLCADTGDFSAYVISVPSIEYVGSKGVRALLPVVKVNQVITRFAVPGQGADDDFVADLCPLLKQHERLHVIDLRDNPEVTDASGDILALLIKTNKAITDVELKGTSISPMVQRTLKRFAADNKRATTIFLTGDYVGFKKLFDMLDADRSGAVSMLDTFGSTQYRDIFDAIESRFLVMDVSGDSKLQIDEFLNFLHPNFFPMKERLQVFLKTPDASEETVVANWATIREAARRSLVECSSFHLARVNHKLLSQDEATLLIREAVVHEHKRTGTTPDCTSLVPPRPELAKGVMVFDQLKLHSEKGDKRSQALLDMYTTIQVRSMYFAVESLYGAQEREYWLKNQQFWSPVYNIRIPPSLARRCHAAFTQLANENIELARSRFRDVHAVEVVLGEILQRPVLSDVWNFDGTSLRRTLEKDGLDLATLVTFAEWFTLLNDRFDIAFGIHGEGGVVINSPIASPRK